MAIQTFQIPTFSVSTSSTTSFDLINANNQSTTFNLMPWAGTINRILLGHDVDIGDGFVAIKRYPNGVGPPVVGSNINYTGTAGAFTEKIDVDVAFNQDDGIEIAFLADGIAESANLYVSLEIEFTLA